MSFEPNVLIAFSLTLLAGLATGIGSTIAFFSRQTNSRFLAGSLGFSAGVMIYVSLVEIFPNAQEAIQSARGESNALLITTLAFFGGIIIIMIIDFLVPNVENPHESRAVEEMLTPEESASRARLMQMGITSALAIGIHNFPEGLATFTSALKDPTLGVGIAIAIAIHNIPEGIAVSVPVFYATGNRRKAFTLSFLSGLSEPIGAAVGYLLLMPFLNDLVFGILFAAISGIMVFISLDQLLPTAEKYGEHHVAIYGLISGMAIMALSLILLQ